MKIMVLVSLMLLFVLAACSNTLPPATPDIPATVTAQVAQQLADLPTATALPTVTPLPTPTDIPTPTTEPTLRPSPTPVPTATPTPTPTATLTPTPRPTNTPRPVVPVVIAPPTLLPVPTIALPTFAPIPTIVRPTLRPLPTFVFPTLRPLPTFAPLPTVKPPPTAAPPPTLGPVVVRWKTYEVDGHDFKVDYPVGWEGDEPFASPIVKDTGGEGTCQKANGQFEFRSTDGRAIVAFEWDYWGGVNSRTKCFWRNSLDVKDIVNFGEGDEVISSDYVTKHGETRRWQYLYHVRQKSDGEYCDQEHATLASITRHYIIELNWWTCESSVEGYREVLDHFLGSFSSRDSKRR